MPFNDGWTDVATPSNDGWVDAPPSEQELDQIFSSTKGQVAGIPQRDPFSYSKAETDAMRQKFVQDQGTPTVWQNPKTPQNIGNQQTVMGIASPQGMQSAEKAKQWLKTPTAEPTGVVDFATRVVPTSAAKAVVAGIQAPYEMGQRMVDPLIDATADYVYGGKSGLEAAGEGIGGATSGAVENVKDVAKFLGTKTGLIAPDAEGNLNPSINPITVVPRIWHEATTDPVGTALALGGVKAGAKGVVKGVAEVPRTVANVLEGTANKLEDMTLKQPTTLKPSIREQNIKTALEGDFQPNNKGVDNLNRTIKDTENKLAEGITSGDASGVRGTLDKAIANIESLRDFANRSSNPVANNAFIDAEIKKLQEHPLLAEDGTIDIGTLQKMKVEQGREIQNTYGEQKPQFSNAIDKARVRGLKEELESRLDESFPELANTNKQLGEYYNLKKSLERATNRINNREGIGISLPIKSGGGAGLGAMFGATGAAVGGAIGTIIGIIEHPKIAPKIARQLYNASKSIKGGIDSYGKALDTTKQRLSDLKNTLIDTSGMPTKNSGESPVSFKNRLVEWENGNETNNGEVLNETPAGSGIDNFESKGDQGNPIIMGENPSSITGETNETIGTSSEASKYTPEEIGHLQSAAKNIRDITHDNHFVNGNRGARQWSTKSLLAPYLDDSGISLNGADRKMGLTLNQKAAKLINDAANGKYPPGKNVAEHRLINMALEHEKSLQDYHQNVLDVDKDISETFVSPEDAQALQEAMDYFNNIEFEPSINKNDLTGKDDFAGAAIDAIPDHIARVVQEPREVPQSVGIATKEQTKATLRDTLPHGGTVRLTNVEEINDLIKNGQLSSGKNFEGQPGISAQKFDNKKPIVGYGKNNRISAAVVFPEDAVIGKGMAPNEVKIDPRYPVDRLQFAIDGYPELMNFQQLRQALSQ